MSVAKRATKLCVPLSLESFPLNNGKDYRDRSDHRYPNYKCSTHLFHGNIVIRDERPVYVITWHDITMPSHAVLFFAIPLFLALSLVLL